MRTTQIFAGGTAIADKSVRVPYMKKDNVLFGVAGLLVGAIVGFMFANSVNKNAMPAVAQTAPGNTAVGANPALPPDHPPLGSTTGGDPATAGGMQPQVQAALEKAKNEPQNFEAQLAAGDMYYQIGRIDEAVKYYEAAMKLKPGDGETLVKTGNAYFDIADSSLRNGDTQTANPAFAEAEKLYTKALEKDPKNINVRTDLGLTFYLRSPKNLDRAIQEYKASLAVNPDHEITLQNIALAYDEAGKKDELSKTIEHLKQVNPANPAVKKYEGKN